MRQRIPFDEDIALKRCAYAEQKPRFNWASMLGEENYDFIDVRVESDDRPIRPNLGRIAETVGRALTDLLLSQPTRYLQ